MIRTQVTPQRARHHWTDWAGFLFFVSLTVTLLRRAPMLGIMLAPVYLNDAVVGVTFLLRRPAKARLEGWGPRIATYGGTFLVPVFLGVASWRYPSWVALTSAAWALKAGYYFWVLGLVLDMCVVWRLRHSFSLAPQARELVRTGPYRVARHPIYAAHMLMAVGVLLRHFTLPVAFALLTWLALMLARVHYEELVLESTFPEYSEYRRQVGLFGPRIFSARPDRAQPARLPPDSLRASSRSLPADWRSS